MNGKIHTENHQLPDLRVDEVNAQPFRHGSLFSGIGGFDLAAEWMGWENVFHCEWNEFGKKVLNYYWPNAISYDDITKTDFSIHRGNIDILTGGFPCQPYSAAGKRLGKEDERHLWPQMLRAIREIAPRYIVGENVYGLVNWNRGLVFDEVQADLEAEGYEVIPAILPACAVGAAHRRERVWFVAHAYECATQSPGTSGETKSYRSKNNDEPGRWRESTEQFIRRRNVLRIDTNANGGGQQGSRRPERQSDTTPKADWQKYRVVDDGRWPIESPICNGDDGLSARLDGITLREWREESTKAGGNAVMPQLVTELFKSITVHEAEYGWR